MAILAERALRVAMTGVVPDDDPHVIADMQAEIDRLTAERDRMRDALAEYACLGIERCRVEKLKDGGCVLAGVGHCGDFAYRALNHDG